MRFLVLAIAVSSIAALSVAQTGQKPAFEVASIKPSAIPPRPLPGSGQTYMPPIEVNGGRLLARNTTLRALTQFAYGNATASPFASVHTIVGGPEFIDQDHYTVEAKSENALSLDAARRMMQSLLEERFALAVHAEQKEIPVYQLVIGKSGLKMKKLPDDAKGYLRVVPERREVLYAAPISTFVGLAQGWADRLIIDKTGLTGMFEELQTDDVTNNGAAPGANNVAILRFEDNTGLRLIPAREIVEVLVIDHAEKPSAN